ncbi:glycosyltransferase family 2 protein [Dyadobacter linearis]|uniref:glycosyltransferase family 2 protein n=1 Tax=Dyadobacter linearis TaxID=2823330 RepID=UPI001E593CC6|nr:glycosyltransferase family A protein [Dyadobacter sp. CECT 9623]
MKQLELPLVTVILTVFNQEKYLEETLNSVFSQTYPSLQLIVIDNASSDDSLRIIDRFYEKGPAFQLIKNHRNLGLCRAF